MSHIITQYELDKKYIYKISKFLVIDDEGQDWEYNKKLKALKIDLSKINNSAFFLKDLHYVNYVRKTNDWIRGDPIEKTPTTHIIHASYFRVLPKTCFRVRDKFIGKRRPNMFINDYNISYRNASMDKIGPIGKVYTMIQPFGYDFPDIIEANGMTFKLYDLCDPVYLNEKNGYGPEPIFINGIETMPMSNERYTILYKSYISSKNMVTSKKGV